MARPKKLDGEKRTERFNLRFTNAERAFVAEQAAHAGIDETDYLRRRALSLPVSPAPAKADAQLLSELNRIGVNLNQITRSLNSGRSLQGDWQHLPAQLSTILAKVASEYGS